MKKLRVAIIACGMMGQQHIEAVRRIPGTEVVALADPNPAALAGVAEKDVYKRQGHGGGRHPCHRGNLGDRCRFAVLWHLGPFLF